MTTKSSIINFFFFRNNRDRGIVELLVSGHYLFVFRFPHHRCIFLDIHERSFQCALQSIPLIACFSLCCDLLRWEGKLHYASEMQQKCFMQQLTNPYSIHILTIPYIYTCTLIFLFARLPDVRIKHVKTDMLDYIYNTSKLLCHNMKAKWEIFTHIACNTSSSRMQSQASVLCAVVMLIRHK